MSFRSDIKFLKSAIIIAIILNIIVFGSFSYILLANVFIGDDYYFSWGVRVAQTSNPITMDPCDSWDLTSNNMLDQVVETLIAYDLTDPLFPLEGRLAESWYWNDNVTITFILRKNVYFHDGSKFTADCVLHTFERINFFGNATGILREPHHMAAPHSLYKFQNKSPGLTPIFNHSLSYKTDDYNVSLVLNAPFGPAEGLLAYTASSIIHPNSTPVNEMLDLNEDLVIGTGPFKLVRYIPDSEIIFARWERYWRTGTYFDGFIYVYYDNAVSANNAMLAGDIEYLGQGLISFKPDFEADPDITVTGDGVNNYINGSSYYYFGFKSEWINLTWRKAICHAFNFTYLIRDIQENTVVKANSLVPPGFPGHNSTVEGGIYNILKARYIMQSMDFGVGWDVGTMIGNQFIPGTDENLWKAAEFRPDIGYFTDNEWTFYLREGSAFQEVLIQKFAEDMEMIGIKVTPRVLTWDEWPLPIVLPEECHFAFLRRDPDYFEAFNMIDSLVNPESSFNIYKINNSEINNLLMVTASETNTAQRYEYYKKLQYLIHDKYYYHIPLFYDKIHFVHNANLKGIPYNPINKFYWYPTYF